VVICAAPATGKTREVIAIRFTNLDAEAHSPVVKKTISGTTVAVEQVSGVPIGACERGWCSRDVPYVLAAGESLAGALLSAGGLTQPSWLVEFMEGTD